MPGIRRLADKSGGVGVVYGGPNEREEIAYCQRCLEMVNIRSRLGNRVYMPDSSGQINIPPDADLWRQCHLCGSIYARYEVKKEGELTSLTDPIDNPFKFGNSTIHGVESRKNTMQEAIQTGLITV